MTEKEQKVLQIIKDEKSRLTTKQLELSPRDKEFHQLRYLRVEINNIFNKIENVLKEE